MDGKIEKYVCNKFCVKLGKSATETSELICEGFGKHSLSRIAVFEWHSRFKVGRVSVEDDESLGLPDSSKTIENVEKYRELIHEDHHRTIHELADTLGISYGVFQEIFTENLIMGRITVKFLSRLLTTDRSS
jgi:hypothetical protein